LVAIDSSGSVATGSIGGTYPPTPVRPGHGNLPKSEEKKMEVGRVPGRLGQTNYAQEAAMPNYPYGEPHNCDESRGDGEVKLACGCMLPVVAGALSPHGQLELK